VEGRECISASPEPRTKPPRIWEFAPGTSRGGKIHLPGRVGEKRKGDGRRRGGGAIRHLEEKKKGIRKERDLLGRNTLTESGFDERSTSKSPFLSGKKSAPLCRGRRGMLDAQDLRIAGENLLDDQKKSRNVEGGSRK